ncbi:MAG: hypothetical protein QOF23_1876 [Solirubrobacterales bacterium]|nr:hypothetical protein [Solirubrobacterales bacterium]
MIESSYLPWRISGTYLEACNCDAICPCRTIGGRRGGRSTEGICLGSLSWLIEDGTAGEDDLSGLRTVLALRYDDDEPGSPWDFVLYLDRRAGPSQHEALEGIFLGRLGGTPEVQFPWVWKQSRLLGVRRVAIEIDHTPGRGWFRAGGQVTVRVREPLADSEPVTCVIPGHHQRGREVIADRLAVDDGALAFELTGRCGYESSFAYSSQDS